MMAEYYTGRGFKRTEWAPILAKSPDGPKSPKMAPAILSGRAGCEDEEMAGNGRDMAGGREGPIAYNRILEICKEIPGNL